MTRRTSRSRTAARCGVLALAAGALLATGCGSDDSGSSTGTSAAGGSSAPKPMKVAMLLSGAVSGSAYNTDAQRTANEIKKKLGIDITIVQSVKLPNQTDVYSQFARQGYNLVIGWGGEFSDGGVAAAKANPKTEFLVVNSTVENGTNLSSVDENFEQWQFVAGYVEARISKSKVVGWIGGQCFPATAAQLNGTKQGAEYADKSIKFLSTFTGDFDDPTKGQQAAQAMIDNHADGIASNLDRGTVGLIKAGQDAGNVRLITEWADNHALAPDTIATSVLKSQVPVIVPLVEKAQKGQLGGQHVQVKLPENWGPTVAKTDLVPDNVYQDALSVQEKVASGQIQVKRVETCPK